MRIEIQFDPMTNMNLVYAFSEVSDRARVYFTIESGMLLAHRVNHGQPIEPMLRLDGNETLLRDIADKIGPRETPADKRHLDDAIAVRNRLLAIVERYP